MKAGRVLLLGALALAPACAAVLGFEEASLDPGAGTTGGGMGTTSSGASTTTTASSTGTMTSSGTTTSASSASGGGAGGHGGAGQGGSGQGGGHGGGGGAATVSCADYCAEVMANCTSHPVYFSKAMCLSVCAALPLGTAAKPVGNTVACRAANAAAVLTTGEPDTECPVAGPGGGGTCGSDCEGYCALMAGICPGAFADDKACTDACALVPNPPGYAAVPQPSGNTLDCRLYHVSAAGVSPDVHCPHAAGAPPCADP